MRNSYSMWVYLAVAGVIATLAFAAGQARSGSGVFVALLGSTLWAAHSVRRRDVARRG